MAHFLVTGAGPVGRSVARELSERHHRVTVMTRSGTRIHSLPAVAPLSGDARNPDAYPRDIDGIAHCIHAPYDAEAWRRLLVPAERAVIRVAGSLRVPVVFPESVYGFELHGGSITPATPLRSETTGKPGVRASMVRGRQESSATAISVVASDLYGPDDGPGLVYNRLLLNKRLPIALFNRDTTHPVTYLPDFARMLADMLTEPNVAPDNGSGIVMTPSSRPISQAEFSRISGSLLPPLTLRPWMITAMAPFSTDMRGLKEMRPLWETPWDIEASPTKWHATSLEIGIQECLVAKGQPRTKGGTSM